MKRKMFNKVMAASLTATMTMSLAGCGGNAAATEAPADTAADQQATTAETETTESEITVETEEEGPVALTDADGNVYDLGGMEIIIRDW